MLCASRPIAQQLLLSLHPPPRHHQHHRHAWMLHHHHRYHYHRRHRLRVAPYRDQCRRHRFHVASKIQSKQEYAGSRSNAPSSHSKTFASTRVYVPHCVGHIYPSLSTNESAKSPLRYRSQYSESQHRNHPHIHPQNLRFSRQVQARALIPCHDDFYQKSLRSEWRLAPMTCTTNSSYRQSTLSTSRDDTCTDSCGDKSCRDDRNQMCSPRGSKSFSTTVHRVRRVPSSHANSREAVASILHTRSDWRL
mmetsp:Transcript_33106/g.53819  ORF Transcript_33106/g.53819 Transcript_33106/m.53819 type:complete len:249 (-) Transcript_33106:756-1502(-)